MAESDAPFVGSRFLSLEEQLSKFPSELLDRLCIESHLGKVVHDIDTETIIFLATFLELSAVEVDGIRTSWQGQSAAQRLELLKKWKEQKMLQVTYK